MASRAASTACAVPRRSAWMCTEAAGARAAIAAATASCPGPITAAMRSTSRRLQRVQHVRDERQAADLVQHFGKARAHARALAGCQHHRQTCAHIVHPRRHAGGEESSACPASRRALPQNTSRGKPDLPMQMSAGRLRRRLAVIVLVPLFFSTNVVIGRSLVAEVGPWTLAFLRWSGAFLILLPFAGRGLVAHWSALRASRPARRRSSAFSACGSAAARSIWRSTRRPRPTPR